MKYSIEFTETAKSDLRNIAIYIAEQAANKDLAKNFVRQLLDQCTVLEDFPLSGSVPKDRTIKCSGYRFLVHNEYLIFYSLEEEAAKVYIQAIFNAKKDYVRIIKKLI